MAGRAASGVGTAFGARAGGWADDVLAFAERSHARAAALLLCLALAGFLPGFVSLQPMDRDEPRFAQATKQMLETGDFVDIRFQDEARYKKPIGIHWMQAATVAGAEALGLDGARTTIAVYRLPSLAGALASVLLTYWAALAFAGRREAFCAAALMAASIILTVEARLAKTDAVLLACCTAAMGALARVWLSRSLPRQPGRTVAIFWAAVAAGILVKGPMVVMFAGLAAATLSLRERSARWLGALRPGIGFAIVAACVLPWFLLIAWKSGGEFYRLAVGDDMLGKVTTGQQKHGAPPGFYLVAVFATFWPGAIAAAIALPLCWRERGQDWAAFLLAWIVPAWLIFEAVPTKLPHYVMPLYPALAIVAVVAVARGYAGPWRPGARAAWLAVPFIPLGLFAGLGYAAWTLDGTVPAGGLLVVAAALGVAVAGTMSFWRGDVVAALAVSVAAAIVLSVGVFGLVQPRLASLKMSPRLAAGVAAAGCPDPEVVTLGYREPSLVFLVGTELDMVTEPADAAAFLMRGGCRVALVADRFEPGFVAALAGTGLAAELAARVAGFNVNGGRRQSVGIWVARP